MPRAVSRRPSAVPPLLFVLAALAPAAACAEDPTKPPDVALASGDATVRVSLEPFAIEILDAKGASVLRTVSGSDGDAYGSPAATRDEGVDNVKVIPGWDGFVPEEKPWAHA